MGIKVKSLSEVTILGADDPEDGWQALANAVVEQAAKDYNRCLRHLEAYPDSKEYKARKKYLERFFRSGYLKLLSDVNGEYLIQALQRGHFRTRRQKLRRKT